MPSSLPIRVECPPGVCDCRREQLFHRSDADLRILQLTREEEKKLLQRLEHISSLEDLVHLQQKIHSQLGLTVHIAPGGREVRTLRGIHIELSEMEGLCRKTRQTIPAAIRKGLERTPSIAWALLDAHDLLGQPAAS